MKLQFSGHESFICKHFWLKKGYDFIQKDEITFNDDLAVAKLGVGRNMVTAITYWLKAYGITDSSNNLTEFANYLFQEGTGKDPYLENLGSIWLLHYNLIKTNKASLYSFFFNEFRRDKIEFTKEQFSNFLQRKVESSAKANVNANTINVDITVFIRNYLKAGSTNKKVEVEEEFSNLMIDLQFMDSYTSENAEGRNVEWYRVENAARIDLPYEVVLFTILDNETYGMSVSFKELLSGFDSPGSIFALSDEGLYDKLRQIVENYKGISYRETAGVRELQFKSKPQKWSVLNDYYRA
ncbi:MAG: hypothetical protein JWP69_1681 [Flaviaesturariibacter sp.]|nr:hypothetical protein [Flaviaesturariibacter sp.]